MNILDRAIAVFAPQAGLRRAEARVRIDMLRGYDGAKMGRRTSDWTGSNASANSTTRGALDRLRARSRDVVRNTWWGPRVVSVFAAHAVGTGITPVFKTGNRTLDRRARRAWDDWARRCDHEGQLDLYGIMALACRSIVENGEVLCRVIPTGSADRMPIRLQLLEPDHLDGARDRIGVDSVIDQGIEYDRNGRRTRYWILPQHPGFRGIMMTPASVPVPADQIFHAYRKDRIGQGRGVPWCAPILLKGRDVADLEEAITVKARVEACLALLVKQNDTARTLAQSSVETGRDGNQRRIETMSPAMIRYLDPGEDVAVVNPSSSLAFESVLLNSWMTLAAGAGITYDQLTGDLRQANYSSLRAGKIEFRRIVEQFQWLTLVPMLLDPIVSAFSFWAQEAGVLPARASGYPAEWIMPAIEPIDPKKDLDADIAAVRAGRMTWPQFVAAWGFDPDEQLEQIAEWQKRLDDKGVVVDTDGRRPRNGGGVPSSQSDEETGDEQKPKPE